MIHQLALWVSLCSFCFPAGSDSAKTDLKTNSGFNTVRVKVTKGEPVQFDLPAGQDESSYLVVIGSLGSGESTRRLTIDSRAVDHAEPIVTAPPFPAKWSETFVKNRRQEMLSKRNEVEDADDEFALRKTPARRTFHIFVKEDNFLEASAYCQVNAKLVATGKSCVIYVDESDVEKGISRAVIDDAMDAFDNRILPGAKKIFGHHVDVDRDGKFAILFTHVLGKLSNNKVSLGGFVRGADFYRDLEAPFSNACDMMYLNTNLQAGSQLRTIMAHEYVHAITFCEHVFGRYLPGAGGADEEAWLNEAISHLSENLLGSGWSNLDYRVSTFLSAPNRYRLVVNDYYRAGLWRCAGSRGSTFLFLRWIVDRYGVGVLKDLTQSNLVGEDNLESATQTPFCELFRDWSVAVSLAGMRPGQSQVYNEKSLELFGRLGDRLLAGCNVSLVNDGREEYRMMPTSFLPLKVVVGKEKAKRITIAGPSEGEVQVTVVRLPDDLPTIELVYTASKTVAKTGMLKLTQTAGPDVVWEKVSCERAFLPQMHSDENAIKAEVFSFDEIFAAKGTMAGSVLRCDSFEPSCTQESCVIKAVGTDRNGRRVSAWATAKIGTAELIGSSNKDTIRR